MVLLFFSVDMSFCRTSLTSFAKSRKQVCAQDVHSTCAELLDLYLFNSVLLNLGKRNSENTILKHCFNLFFFNWHW